MLIVVNRFVFNCSLVAAIDDGSNQVEALVKGDLVWQILNLTTEYPFDLLFI